jgi:hypothetical protein
VAQGVGSEFNPQCCKKKKKVKEIKIQFLAGHWWHMPVTLATGSRDQEEHGMKPAQGKQFARPYLKNTQYKKGEHLP